MIIKTMERFQKLSKKNAFFRTGYRLVAELTKATLSFLPDRMYLKLKYKDKMGKPLDLKNPRTFNEKLQWLKIYDRNPVYTDLVDKYKVREHVAQTIGPEHLVPLLGVWEKFADIDFDKLPNQFVLKCTHDSGSVAICTDKNNFDFKGTNKKISKSLRRNYYGKSREWPYKNIKPQIIAEKFMVDESGNELKDYKFFCFDGKVKLMFIASDRLKNSEETKFDYYDINFNLLPFVQEYPNSNIEREKPDNFEDMIRCAELLSDGIPHVRVDFYSIKNQIFFGEMTFFHFGGMSPFHPEEWDNILGEWIDLSKAHNHCKYGTL